MGNLLERIRDLVRRREVKISEHGYDEMAEDGIFARDVIHGVLAAVSVEEYPDYPKGPCILVLQEDRDGRPIHVVWGIPKGASSPAVVVTVYRPDPERWTRDFLRRKR